MSVRYHARLRTLLLDRYRASAAEYYDNDGNPTGYRCRRCLRRVGMDNGSDDLAGLCDDCWCDVDRKLRGDLAARFVEACRL